ncbi:DUF4369 domain-containing protein [Polaribacter sp. MSW13]|uniref:DUF4369 domain-containing protein n=1 Tax=Polaribacter marinus TaxID=2916838 RepID=A0A9X2AL27_9FLAO|nr:DUF4369 domain-containing protein [Polaribacter marinus]MCI2230128.1 DUF4369 domain-containing protein [Polaribacter marinus]
MKKIIAILALSILVVACNSKKEGNMIVQGTIKGLKKGTLYLQKMQDSALVSIDSVAILGSEKFKLTDNVDSPVLYFLTFDGNTTDKRILFFGEKGIITINDNIDQFGFNPEISGSKNQEIFDKYTNIDKKFQNLRLDFIKKDFDARKENNQELIKQLAIDFQKLERRRVLFATNYAMTNPESEASAYIALTLNTASLKMLDTINSSLSEKVKNSVYGKELQKYISEIKESEKK